MAIRRYQIFKEENFTNDMKAVLADVKIFEESSSLYDGLVPLHPPHPYRRGYLLYGPPCTGKSTLTDIICQLYGMRKYVIAIDKNTTDGDLLRLVNSVEVNGMIVFDEIDKQMDLLTLKKKLQMTFGGLESAICGSIPLNRGVIVILTANSLGFMKNKEERDQLIRDGRIDKVFQLNTIYPVNNSNIVNNNNNNGPA